MCPFFGAFRHIVCFFPPSCALCAVVFYSMFVCLLLRCFPFILSFSIIITTATAACINYKPNANTLSMYVRASATVFHAVHVNDVDGGESRMSHLSNFIFFDLNNLLGSVKCVRCTLRFSLSHHVARSFCYSYSQPIPIYIYLTLSHSLQVYYFILWVCQLFQLRSQLERSVSCMDVINANGKMWIWQR